MINLKTIFILLIANVAIAGAAPLATLERIPFRVELYPKNKTFDFWAYQQEKTDYIPARILAKILSAKIHHYAASSSVIISVEHGRTFEFKEGRAWVRAGSKILWLERPIRLSPGGDDLLIPVEALRKPGFQRYGRHEVEESEEGRLKFFKLQNLPPPLIRQRPGGLFIELELPPAIKNYEITYHQDQPEILKSPSKPKGKKIPVMAVRIPYAKPPLPSVGLRPASYIAIEDSAEKSTIFYFLLGPGAEAGDIEARQLTWPKRRLEIEVRRPAPEFAPEPAMKAPPLEVLEKTPPRLHLKVKKKAALTPSPRKSLPPMPSRPLIIIDPGHGGRDSGTIGKNGLQEKNLNLVLARKLQQHLKASLPEASVILSRPKDLTLDLHSRAQMAKKKKAALFLSIHANAAKASTKGGYEIYIPASVSWDPAGAELANRENRAKGVLLDPKITPERRIIRQSSRLAQSIDGALAHKSIAQKIQSRGILKGDFYVLREAGVPAVLIETAFLTHGRDLKAIQNPSFQDLFTRQIAKGVALYFNGKK